jgi:hypothetical protein
MNAYLVLIVTSVLVGLACAAIAHRTQRDPLRWFLAGALLNLLALAVIVLANKRGESHAAARRG